MFEDLCLYSQVIEQMSLYNYKLNMRRFIQGFFEPVKFTQVCFPSMKTITNHFNDRSCYVYTQNWVDSIRTIPREKCP